MIPIRHPSLTKDHEKFVELVDELSRRFIEPIADKVDRENYYPREVIRELGKNGVLAPILRGSMVVMEWMFWAQHCLLRLYRGIADQWEY